MDRGRAGKSRRAATFALAAMWVLAAAAPAAAEDPAAALYRPGTVNVIKLVLPPSSISALEADPEGEYQPGTFSMAETDGTPAGIGEYSTPIEAQIRLKGSGSFRPLGQKAAFKIKFGKKAPFLGLRKMALNNMVQDASMIHETLAYRVFHAMGVPASRGSYAEVWVNGVDYGLHFNIETLDKVALEKRFGTFEDPPQHLYEGEYNADVTADRVSLLEVDEGDEEDRSDLEALRLASTTGSGDWSDRVAPHANLTEMTRMWMAEKYIGHVDGYAGADGANEPNNFYLYSDPAGQFRMLPWGTDQTWVFSASFGGSAGSLFDRCLADAICKARYGLAGERALATIPGLNLDTTARCVALRLQAWQKREPPAMGPAGPQAIAEAVTATRKYAAGQSKVLANYLSVSAPTLPPGEDCPAYGAETESLEEPPAEELPSEEEEGEEESGGEEEVEEPEEEQPEGEQPEQPSAGGGSPLASAPTLVPGPPVPAEESPVLLLRLGRLDFDRRGLVVQVKAPRPGRLQLKVSGDRSDVICRSDRRVRTGTTEVGCVIPHDALATLASHPRWLSIAATLRIASGEKLNCWRTLKSPRPGRPAAK
ncbi:MAG TPA: CotH kinase family protein [Solirubrobacterales bacterium]